MPGTGLLFKLAAKSNSMRLICCILTIIQALSASAISISGWCDGDIIERSRVSGVKLTDSVCDISLAKIEEDDACMRISRLSDGHSWVVREKKQRFYLDFRGDSLMWTGYENRLQEMHGSGAMVLVPGMLCDTCASCFTLDGMYSLVYPMSESGDVTSSIKLMNVVLAGDIIQDAQAVRTFVRSAITDSISFLPTAQESVRIYIPGYPYASVEFRGARPFEYIPGSLSGLQWDYVFVASHLLLSDGANKTENQKTKDNVPYTFTVDGRNVNVEVRSECADCEIEVSLCSLSGVIYVSQKREGTKGGYSATLPLPSNRLGDCLLVIRIGEDIYKELIRR